MKKLIPVLLLSLFALQSCRDKETVYIETPVVSQPEKNEEKSPHNNKTDEIEVPNNTKDQQKIKEEEGNKIVVKCERDKCNESVGYVRYKDTICQAVQVEENEVLVSKTCLDPKSLGGLKCNKLSYHSDNFQTNCSKISLTENGYYKIHLIDLLGSNSIKFGKPALGSNIEEIRFTLSKINHVDESLFECDLEFNSFNNLDANAYDSKILYSLNCKSDFLFSNQELIGVKVGEDNNGNRYHSINCKKNSCEGAIQKKEKVLNAFYKTDYGKIRKEFFENKFKENAKTMSETTFEIKGNKLVGRRSLECVRNAAKDLFTSLELVVRYEVKDNGVLKVMRPLREDSVRKYYYPRFHFENDPIMRSNRDINISLNSDVINIDSILNDGNSSENRPVLDDYYHYYPLFNVFEVYTSYESNISYESFVRDLKFDNLDRYEKIVVPKCEAPLI